MWGAVSGHRLTRRSCWKKRQFGRLMGSMPWNYTKPPTRKSSVEALPEPGAAVSSNGEGAARASRALEGPAP